jgi:hypothetical protein
MVNAAMEDARSSSLCRFYEDFYDFQIALLDEFNKEAGHTGAWVLQEITLHARPGDIRYRHYLCRKKAELGRIHQEAAEHGLLHLKV